METIKNFPVPVDISAGIAQEKYPYLLGEPTVLQSDAEFVYSAYSFGGTSFVYPITLTTMKNTVRDAEATGRWAIAQAFADHVRHDPRVREVWYDDAPDDAALTLIATEVSLDDELHFEAALIAVMDSIDHPFGGFLRIYAEDTGVPEHATAGRRLLP